MEGRGAGQILTVQQSGTELGCSGAGGLALGASRSCEQLAVAAGEVVDGGEVGERPAGWSLSLYRTAGEAGGAWGYSSASRLGRRASGGSDPERSAVEAGRRARGQIRRYCTANRLNRLGTLTYRGAGCHDERQLRSDLAEFFRALRVGTGGDPFPYLWVPEWHKTDHGLHAHFAVGSYIRRRLVESAWGHGFVHIKLLGDLPVGSGALAEARRAALYLSKYVAKEVDRPKVAGLHRYEVAQGFEPACEKVWSPTLGGVIAEASSRMGASPGYVWQSQVADGWRRPPAVWLSWG